MLMLIDITKVHQFPRRRYVLRPPNHRSKWRDGLSWLDTYKETFIVLISVESTEGSLEQSSINYCPPVIKYL